MDNDITPANYEGHGDDDLLFFPLDTITSPGYRGHNQNYDEGGGKVNESRAAVTIKAEC